MGQSMMILMGRFCHCRSLVDGGPSAISDINGDYRIEEVPVGLVDVSVMFIGYEGKRLRSPHSGG